MKSNYIYADNAATTQMSRAAIDAMLPYFDEIYGNPSSLHSAGVGCADAMRNSRVRIAELLGCKASEIIFTSGGSESDNQAIISAAYIGAGIGKKHIISTKIEHHAVLRTLEYLQGQGFDITLVDVDENGAVSPESIRKAIREDTCLVSVMYANNEIGTIQPIKAIGEICRAKKILFHTDAVQAAGHVGINVSDENIDMLSLSAHKFHGPKGIGVLYAKRGIDLCSLIRGGSQERGCRAGTENIPYIVGMTAALAESLSNLEKDTEYITDLRDRLIDGLLQIPDSCLNGDRSNRLPGNISVSFKGISGESLVLMLDQRGICASAGAACASGELEPSHVLKAIGRERDYALGTLRLSLCASNTREDVDRIIRETADCISFLRDQL